MPRAISGKRYAQAAFELAKERTEFDSWRASLEKIADLTGDERLMALLEPPKLPFAAKKDLLKERLGEVNPLALNLALLLLSRGRFRAARSISQHYARLLDAHRGIEHAEVVTAMPLGDEHRGMISRRLGEMVGREVIVDVREDPSIIGGFRAKIGDLLIDGSVQHRLESLRKSLVAP